MRKRFVASIALFAAVLFVSGRVCAVETIELSGSPSTGIYHNSVSDVSASETFPDYSSWPLAGQQWKYAEFLLETPLVLLTPILQKYYVENPDNSDSPYVMVATMMEKEVFRYFQASNTAQLLTKNGWRTIKSGTSLKLYLVVKPKYWLVGPAVIVGARVGAVTDKGERVSTEVIHPAEIVQNRDKPN